jgi:hypothetical protein
MKNFSRFGQNKLKTLLAIGIALVITVFLCRIVFWQNTPLINPMLVLQSQNLAQKLTNWPKNILALFSQKQIQKKGGMSQETAILPTTSPQTFQPPSPNISSTPIPTIIHTVPTTIPTIQLQPTISASINLAFQPIGSGVSTATGNSGQKYIKIEAGTVVEIQEYTLVDGRQIKVIKPL